MLGRCFRSESDFFGGALEKKGYRRKIRVNCYTYGFNGKEKDQDGEWGASAVYDYGFRIYNPGIAKFLSVDPLTKEYPWYTPYQFAGNKPILAIDLDGLEELIYTKSFAPYKFTVLLSVVGSKHLSDLMSLISDPERSKSVKIYFASNKETTGDEYGSTVNLIKAAKYVRDFKTEFSEELNDPMKYYRLMNNPQVSPRLYKYIDYSDFIKDAGLTTDEIIRRSEEDQDLQLLLVNLQRTKVGYGKFALKTFYHEIELHTSRIIGARMNVGGGEAGADDHNYGFSFYKYRKYYEEKGYTEEDLRSGTSPRKEDIIEDSPTGKTDAEIDKFYESFFNK